MRESAAEEALARARKDEAEWEAWVTAMEKEESEGKARKARDKERARHAEERRLAKDLAFQERLQRNLAEAQKKEEQAAGCGGFGKGNFSELFKSIEDYERTLEA